MTKFAALAAAVALTAGASSALLGQEALAAKAPNRCGTQHAYHSNTTVTVYRRASGFDDGVGNPLTVFYACARPRGRSVAVASSSPSGEYPSNDVLKELVLAGDYAGSVMVQGTGDESVCEKYAQAGCPTPRTVVRVADARSLRLVAIPVPKGTHGLLLSPSHGRLGAAAWLEPINTTSTLVGTELAPKGAMLASAPRKLDTGVITGVKVTGETVSWVNAGVRHSAVLHHP